MTDTTTDLSIVSQSEKRGTTTVRFSNGAKLRLPVKSKRHITVLLATPLYGIPTAAVYASFHHRQPAVTAAEYLANKHSRVEDSLFGSTTVHRNDDGIFEIGKVSL